MSEENFAVKLRSFASKILYFNGLYKLPVAPIPSLSLVAKDEHSKAAEHEVKDHLDARDWVVNRILSFKEILIEECYELDAIQTSALNHGITDLDILTELADLLGDIVVYCHSEAAKYGIPLEEVLGIIMDSNFSKLGADGKVILDKRGKVMKGPFYWKPEGKIRELLEERMIEGTPRKG